MSRTAAIVALSEGYRAGDLVHVVPATLDGVDRGWWQGEALLARLRRQGHVVQGIVPGYAFGQQEGCFRNQVLVAAA